MAAAAFSAASSTDRAAAREHHRGSAVRSFVSIQLGRRTKDSKESSEVTNKYRSDLTYELRQRGLTDAAIADILDALRPERTMP